jgi:Carbohydrate phosphorylase
VGITVFSLGGCLMPDFAGLDLHLPAFRKSIIKVGSSGKSSSDRTIEEYAADIWNVKPVHVNQRLN